MRWISMQMREWLTNHHFVRGPCDVEPISPPTFHSGGGGGPPGIALFHSSSPLVLSSLWDLGTRAGTHRPFNFCIWMGELNLCGWPPEIHRTCDILGESPYHYWPFRPEKWKIKLSIAQSNGQGQQHRDFPG